MKNLTSNLVKLITAAALALQRPPPAKAAQPYIPVISKGFQHQFWQAVKLGAEKAAKDFNVKITFEGPETESQVDKQIEMLQAALAKKPGRPLLRRPRQQGRRSRCWRRPRRQASR